MAFGAYQGNDAADMMIQLHLDGNNTDSSGNALSGTDSNITYGLDHGKINQGASFNGSSSKISFADNAAFSIGTGDVTVAFRCYAVELTPYTTILNKRAGTGGGQFIVQCGSTATEMSFFIYDGGAGQSVVTTAGTMNLNTRTYFVFTRQAGTMKAYVNGALNNTSTGSAKNPDNSGAFEVGSYASGGSRWNGKIDELTIEKNVRSPEKVQKQYTYAKGIYGII